MKTANCKLWSGTLMSLTLIPVAALVLSVGAAQQKPPTPLPHAHAHNDYEHARPLVDALDRGFCGVEADIWLVKGQLLVAHDLQDAKPERTLQALYLDPLRTRVAQNGGKVFRDGPTILLLIDVKSDATNTYIALRGVLKRYNGMLTRFSPTQTATGAVTVVISGNRARGLMAAEKSRLAAYDGRLVDLDSGDSRDLIPLVSDNWTQHFKWRARPDEGPLSVAESAKLKQLVERAHQQGRRLRLWATPDNTAMWTELRDAGVDYMNTDDLPGLEKFLLEQRQPK